MFSYDERIKAVKLFFEYNSWTLTVKKLGYPSIGALREWVSEYAATGDVKSIRKRRLPKYSETQIQHAVDYYLKHGRNIARTIRDLGLIA